jgi:Sulfotransferase family
MIAIPEADSQQKNGPHSQQAEGLQRNTTGSTDNALHVDIASLQRHLELRPYKASLPWSTTMDQRTHTTSGRGSFVATRETVGSPIGHPEHSFDEPFGGSNFAEPLFILAPPRSFTSIISAMLGQHPHMYALPELQLFEVETMTEWRKACSGASYFLRHGLLRAVAQLYFGAQTERTIQLAQAWIRRRSYFTTGMMFETVVRQIYPRVAVEKSPAMVYRMASMHRMLGMFPGARFLHLVRHPRGYGESVLKAIKESGEVGPVPQWLNYLASYPSEAIDGNADAAAAPKIDPQRGWPVSVHLAHATEMTFCS